MGIVIGNPLVSVCVPVYNGEQYLKECLDSIIAQSFTDLEVIIVDDCSIDSSYELALHYASLDQRIRVVRNQRNLGLVSNWNKATLLANCEWIKFLFQDDLLEPSCIEKMLSATTDDTLMVICGRKLIFENCDPSTIDYFNSYAQRFDARTILGNSGYITIEQFCEAILNNFLENFLGEPTSVMIRKDVFAKYNLFNRYLVQLCDFEYWLRVGTNVGFVYVPDYLANFRIHESSETSRNQLSKEFRKNHLDQLICYYELATNPYYENLRSIANSRVPKVDFELLFRNKYTNIIDMLSITKEHDDHRRIELMSLMKQYPLMKAMSKPESFFQKFFTV